MATFDRTALGAPAQHAARQIRDSVESRLLQNGGRLGRASACAANRNHRAVLREFTRAFRQLA